MNPFNFRETSKLSCHLFTCQFQFTRVVFPDDVPYGCKEDLLFEISMLKMIGQHSNIVKLKAACTLAEPIALVLEYMPFGNMQVLLRYSILFYET